jgi:hypothetical protein
MARANDYNLNALFYQEQIVILDTTNASSTSGGLVVKGGISGKDTYITGHIAVNNVKITPNKNDIIYEQQATLNITEEFTDITDFYFDNSVANSFKAIVNVNVNAGISKYALWEINGVYKPSGWVITSSFTGELTGISFKVANSNGRGQIQYKNSNANGTTTTIRYRASTTAPPGTTPLSSDSGIINNTSGPYIANRLLYSNSADTIANTDIEYTSNVFAVGGNSRILARNANNFTNFSNGGGLTSMGDASIAKKLIVGQNIGIVTTTPQFTLDVGGDINFTGNFYKNGGLYSGSSIWDTNAQSDIYTTQNLGIGNTDPSYKLDVTGDMRVSNGITSASANITTLNVTNQTATNISSGSAHVTDIKATNTTIGTLNVSGLTAGNINFTGSLYQNGAPYVSSQWSSGSAGNLSYTEGKVGINTSTPTSTLDVNGTLTSTNINTTNTTVGTLNVSSGLTAGNINFTGSLYQNGAPYVSSQWSSGSAGSLTYISGNVGINTTSPTENLHVQGSARVSSLASTNVSTTNATVSSLLVTDVSSTSLTAGSAQVTNVSSTNISSGTLNLSGGLTTGTAKISSVIATNSSLGTVNALGATMGGHVVPSANVTYDLGSPDLRWKDLYLSGNTIYLGDKQLSLADGSFNVDAIKLTSTQNSSSASTGALVVNGGIGAAGNVNVSGTVSSSAISSNNISAGTLNLSNGLTSGNAYINNLSSSTISSSLMVATTITGGDLSLSGNVNIAGSLTVVNITATNLMDTNLTAGIARVTTHLAAVGNSNTIGSLFTTAGNVGVGTTAPSATLDVNGTARISNSVTTGGLEVTGLADALNLTATNVSVGDLRVSGGFSAVNANATLWGLTVSTNVTTGALYSTNQTTTNIVGTNVSSASLNLSSGLTSASAQITNANVTTSTIATLLNTNQNSTNVSSATLNLSTGLTTANAQITNANVTTSTISSLLNTNVVSTNISGGSLNLSTGLTSTSAQITNATIATLLNTNVVSTNVSSSTLNLSSGLTAANAQITNANATTATIASLLNTNTISTNISSASLNLSTGLTATNANVTTSTIATLLNTNAVSTNVSTTNLIVSNAFSAPNAYAALHGLSVATSITTGAVYAANITSSNIVATNISSAILNLSNGLTTINAQATNANILTATISSLLNTNAITTNISSATLNLSTGLTTANANVTTMLNTNTVTTNVSSATLNLSTGLTSANVRVSTSLAAIGTSNTIGNIFTNDGNVGVGVTSPTLPLEIAGRTLIKNAGVGTSGALFLDDSNKGIMYSGNNTSVNTYFEGTFPSDGVAVFGWNDGVLGTKNGSNKTILTWNSRGNVGINTTSPSFNLDVSGNARISDSLTTGGLKVTGLGDIVNLTTTTATLPNVISTNVSAASLNLSTGLTSASAQITNINATSITTGTLLLPTTGGILFRSGASNIYDDGQLRLYTDDHMYFYTGNTSSTRMHINGSGYVGVGKENPTSRLDVDFNGVASGQNVLSLHGSNTSIMDYNLIEGGHGASSFFVVKSTGEVITTGTTTGGLKVTGLGDITNLTTTRATFPNITVTNMTGATLNLSTGLTSASAQITNLNATTATVATLLNTNAVSTNVSSATLNLSTGLTSASAQVTNLNATTATVATLLNTNAVSTNVSSATLNLSTGLTSATAQITNVRATNISTGGLNASGDANLFNLTVGGGFSAVNAAVTLYGLAVSANISTATLLSGNQTSTNIVGTNISSATLNLSSGLTSASAQITNANITTSTIANLLTTNVTTTSARITTLTASTINSTLIAATTITGGSISLSGDLNVAGTLTVVNITATNLMDTNLTAGVARITTNLSAVGNSNTIGNIFTTGGNVGIGTESPGEKLDVRGNLRVGGSTQGNYIGFYGTAGDGPGSYDHSYIGERIYGGGELSELLLFKGNDPGSPSGPDRIRLSATEISFDTHSGISGTFEGVGTSGTRRLTIANNGNVGINTTSPSFTLDVSGTARISDSVTTGGLEVTGLADALNLTATNASIGTLTVSGGFSASAANATLWGLNVSTNITTGALYSTNITSTNIVGTNVSSATLNLSTGLTSASAQITNANVTTSTIATLLNTNLTTSRITTGNLYANGGKQIIVGTTGSFTTLPAIEFYSHTNSTNPLYQLGVYDGQTAGYGLGAYLNASDAGALTMSTTNASWFVGKGMGGWNVLRCTGAIGARATVTTDFMISTVGNVGIGTDSPSVKLDVVGAARITSSLSAIGNSNTLGNIFTTGGNVGINTTTPTFNLDVAGTARISTGITTGALTVLTAISAAGIIVGGVEAVTYVSSGNLYSTNITSTNAVSTNATATSLNVTTSLRATGNSNTLGNLYTTGGSVGIGSTSPSYPLHVVGDIYASGDMISFSDARFKENVVTMTNTLEKLQGLRGVTFNRIDTGTKHIGFIAQEVEAAFPELVSTDVQGYKSVAYGNATAVLVQCIKELKATIDTLEGRIQQLETPK